MAAAISKWCWSSKHKQEHALCMFVCVCALHGWKVLPAEPQSAAQTHFSVTAETKKDSREHNPLLSSLRLHHSLSVSSATFFLSLQLQRLRDGWQGLKGRRQCLLQDSQPKLWHLNNCPWNKHRCSKSKVEEPSEFDPRIWPIHWVSSRSILWLYQLIKLFNAEHQAAALTWPDLNRDLNQRPPIIRADNLSLSLSLWTQNFQVTV